VRNALADDVVDRHERSLRSERGGDGRGDTLHRLEERSDRIELGERDEMPAGHDKNVSWKERRAVEEADSGIVVEHDVRFGLTGDDRTERASGLGGHPPCCSCPSTTAPSRCATTHGGLLFATLTAFPGHAARCWPLLGWRLIAPPHGQEYL